MTVTEPTGAGRRASTQGLVLLRERGRAIGSVPAPTFATDVAFPAVRAMV